MRNSTPARRATLAFLLLPLAGTPLRAQTMEAELAAAGEALEAARQVDLHLISPRNFQRAADKLAEARERYQRGNRIEDVRRRLAEARDWLDEAQRLRGLGERLLGEALATRRAALAVDAPSRVPGLWERAEAEMLEAGRRLERDDREGAGSRAARAAPLFGEAELEAIRSAVLGPARAARDEAALAGARELAPAAFREAESFLAEADQVLEGDRTRRADAARLGERATAGFRRALLLGTLSDSVTRRRLAVEELVTRHEAELAEMAAALGLDVQFSEGTGPVAAQLLAALRSLLEDRAYLQGELARGERENRGLRGEIDTLEARLAGVEAREAEVAARLRERERRERKLREVAAVFSPEEGEVVVAGDRLLLRLPGLTFASGSDRIEPQHYPLLTKVQRVLREFPDAPATIEGHTDSQGNDDFNRALSRRRAVAVRDYLLANLPISAERLSAVGYGEERPIAPNETAAGRAKNRRIDVVVNLAGEGPAQP